MRRKWNGEDVESRDILPPSVESLFVSQLIADFLPNVIGCMQTQLLLLFVNSLFASYFFAGYYCVVFHVWQYINNLLNFSTETANFNPQPGGREKFTAEQTVLLIFSDALTISLHHHHRKICIPLSPSRPPASDKDFFSAAAAAATDIVRMPHKTKDYFLLASRAAGLEFQILLTLLLAFYLLFFSPSSSTTSPAGCPSAPCLSCPRRSRSLSCRGS